MNQIQISPVFFKKERNNYSDWAFGLFRELCQNAVDAGASRIDITLTQEGKKAFVGFKDNGCGFNAKIRDNVYFCLGETSKNDNTTIGGFGKARIVTCFGQDSYAIYSQDWGAKGCGSSYETFDSPWIDGCNVEINVDATDRYDREIQLMTSLHQFLAMSQMYCAVYVNGEQWTSWCYKRRTVKRMSFADICANKNGNYPYYLIVRVSGVPMFHVRTQANTQVVVELDPQTCRETLVSNRDSLHNTYQDELNNFIQELSIDKRSALRSNSRRVILFDGDAKVTKRKLEKAMKVTVMPFEQPLMAAGVSAPSIPAAMSVCHEESERFVMEGIDNLIPSAVVVCESENANVRKVVWRYDPKMWKENGGGNRLKLLRQWTIACTFAIEEWLETSSKDSVSWRPGFLFSDDYHAMKMIDETGTSCLLLNPVDGKGKFDFELRNKKDFARLISLACHEVTHLSYHYHDEEYASFFTTLVGKVMGRMNEVCRTLLESLKKSSV
jgi:Histidine kinase-, DNA gyrase B-, and HSP90-like ATPase